MLFNSVNIKCSLYPQAIKLIGWKPYKHYLTKMVYDLDGNLLYLPPKLKQVTYKSKLEIFRKKINDSREILITTHLNADGDAIGSSTALGLILKKMGKKISIITPNDFPEFLQWLPGVDMIRVHRSKTEECAKLVDAADLMISVDYNEPSRLKKASELIFSSPFYKILIDHHPKPAEVFDLTFSETTYGSTAEYILNIITALGWDQLLDQDIAECFLVGIMTDTGNFSYSCSYPGVWESVASLIKLGADHKKVHSLIYDNYTEKRMKLMGFSLDKKMALLPGLNTAIIALKQDELDSFAHQSGDTEGFVNLPFNIKNIKVSALFIEKHDHVKISFRSRGNFAVNIFAHKHFRGGGHVNAAGGEWDKPIEAAIERFINLISEYKNELQ